MGLFSSGRIYMNYRAMMQSAAKLEELAREMRSIAQSEIAYCSGNQSAWKGDAGDACREKLKKLENNVNKRAKELENTAKAIRIAAERQMKLEMALASIVSV